MLNKKSTDCKRSKELFCIWIYNRSLAEQNKSMLQLMHLTETTATVNVINTFISGIVCTL